jgi:ABC-type polysaccharide/polyol phosphate transport system ATPase subunit
MSRLAIQVENLSKKYQIGQNQARHNTLRDAASNTLKSLVRRDHSAKSENIIWALKDVSFEVAEGQAVGIIGRNGAGKSTLLKILSKITEPTSGKAIIEGRMGSLLEVGTGFHPELTGRENIFLYGAILGMRRREIIQKFDEIVAFADIEKFLDTPVKRYSSGMYVRLAFAVAAHLDPEILVVDEVLAVGDSEFQKRCLGKMNDAASEGRTVLFVSHNLNIIQRLCPMTMLLNQGRIINYGQTTGVVTQYISMGTSFAQPETWFFVNDQPDKKQEQAWFTQVWYSSHSPNSANHPYPNGPLEFRIRIFSKARLSIHSLAVTLYDQYGSKLVNADTLSQGYQLSLQPGENEITIHILELHLNPGFYNLGLWLANPPGQIFDKNDQVMKLEVVDLQPEQLGSRPISDGIVTSDFTISKN